MFRIIGFFLLGMMPLASAWAAPGDAAVRQAQQAFAARKLADLERAAREVPADHVLTPYVEFWRLMLESRSEDARIADFLARYPGSRMAEALRADWLKRRAREVWPFFAEYPRLRIRSRISVTPTVQNGRRATTATSARRWPQVHRTRPAVGLHAAARAPDCGRTDRPGRRLAAPAARARSR
jgi:hypothetical protein